MNLSPLSQVVVQLMIASRQLAQLCLREGTGVQVSMRRWGVASWSPWNTRTGVMALLDTGPGGALTTYSTFGYETVRLLQERFYAVASVVAGLGAAFYGIATAKPSG